MSIKSILIFLLLECICIVNTELQNVKSKRCKEQFPRLEFKDLFTLKKFVHSFILNFILNFQVEIQVEANEKRNEAISLEVQSKVSDFDSYYSNPYCSTILKN